MLAQMLNTHFMSPYSTTSATLRFKNKANTWYKSRLTDFHSLQPDLFVTRPTTPASKRFVVIGDPGSGEEAQLAIAHQMNMTYQKMPFETVLVLGDNVYENGEPALFKERIYDPYHKLFERGVRFFPVMGNHDVRKGFGDQQLTYWGAPSFYNFKIRDVEFFALDTTVFLPDLDGCYDKTPELAAKKAEIEYAWLETALKASTAKTKIAYGHYPLYTSGVHALTDRNVEKMRNRLEPLFQKYGVKLYLAGHDHHYEKTAPIGGVQHIVSGAAGKLTRFHLPYPPYPRDKVIAKNHFMLFEIQDNGSITYAAISKKGTILDSGMIPAASDKTPLYA